MTRQEAIWRRSLVAMLCYANKYIAKKKKKSKKKEKKEKKKKKKTARSLDGFQDCAGY